jgi:hypothetical protein
MKNGWSNPCPGIPKDDFQWILALQYTLYPSRLLLSLRRDKIEGEEPLALYGEGRRITREINSSPKGGNYAERI